MKIQCPKCSTAMNVDESKIPEKGGMILCKNCKGRIPVKRKNPSGPAPVSATDEKNRNGEVTCPKCAHVQPRSDTCRKCGLIFAKYKEKLTRTCPFCDEEVSIRAKKCKHCHEILDFSSGEEEIDFENAGMRYQLMSLLDFSFSLMFTPELVKLLYRLIVVFGAVVTVVAFGVMIYQEQISRAFIFLFSYVIVVIVGRIVAEFTLIAFKVEENTRPKKIE